MAASIALPLTNVVLGLAGIGAGIGFGVAEAKKMKELTEKSDKLKAAVQSSGNLYDHIYYLAAVNVKRLKKSVDKLPSDFLEKVEKYISDDITPSDFVSGFQTAAQVMGWIGEGAGVTSGILKIVIKVRERKASGKKPTPKPGEDPFIDVPLDGENPPVVPEEESSFPESSRLSKISKGLDIAGIVFGVAGLAATIGLGVWTIEKLNDAISEVEKKQKQVDAFQNAMTQVLDPIVKDAGLPAKSYDGLISMAKVWKTISENFDSYEKSMYYAIRGYFLKKPLTQIKVMVKKESDKGKPFPEDGYVLADTLAGDIKDQFDQKKTDKEVVNYFATENPKIGLRFVFDEFFISSLRWF